MKKHKYQQKRFWQLQAIQTMVTKGRETTYQKQGVLYGFGNTKMFLNNHESLDTDLLEYTH